MSDLDELAKLLGTTEENLEKLAKAMGEFTGRKDVLQRLSEELAKERGEALAQLQLSETSGREDPPAELSSADAGRAGILTALMERVKKTEEELLEMFRYPDCSTQEGCRIPIKTVFDLSAKGGRPPKGFFLKEEKARELFLAHPPKGVMAEFGYEDVEKMLAAEDICHLFASLRFLEGRRWMNEEFFAAYSSLTPDDFEKRKIRIEVLPKERFGAIGAQFMRKKFHNVSHLKEMGLIFILPVEQREGVFLRMFSLLLHYLHEVSFYAKYFEQCANPPVGSPAGETPGETPGVSEDLTPGVEVGVKEAGEESAASGRDFTKNLTAALRGDVRETVPPIENLFVWLIIQRYLAKEDPNDPRLALPHVSPEAMFWRQATDDLGRLEGSATGGPKLGLSFWAGKSHVAGIFPPAARGEPRLRRGAGKLLSFNFEDNIFSAATGQEVEPASTSANLGGQYTYHMHEALWNRLFTLYFKNGEELLESLMFEDFAQGFVGFRIRSTEGE